MKQLHKIQVIDKKIHEIKQETLGDYVGEFEMVGRLKIADENRETHSRFRTIDDLESYINYFDQDYESEDIISNGYIYQINTPQFELVKRSQ